MNDTHINDHMIRIRGTFRHHSESDSLVTPAFFLQLPLRIDVLVTRRGEVVEALLAAPLSTDSSVLLFRLASIIHTLLGGSRRLFSDNLAGSAYYNYISTMRQTVKHG